MGRERQRLREGETEGDWGDRGRNWPGQQTDRQTDRQRQRESYLGRQTVDMIVKIPTADCVVATLFRDKSSFKALLLFRTKAVSRVFLFYSISVRSFWTSSRLVQRCLRPERSSMGRCRQCVPSLQAWGITCTWRRCTCCIRFRYPWFFWSSTFSRWSEIIELYLDMHCLVNQLKNNNNHQIYLIQIHTGIHTLHR